MADTQRLMRPHLVKPETYSSAVPLEEMARQAGIPEDQIVRLNANENPFGALPEIVDSLRGLPLHLYPDPDQRAVREALSEYTGHPTDRLLAGAGSDELIDLLMRLFVAPRERVLDCDPTFGMYRFCARVADADVVSVPRDEFFQVDVAAVSREDDERTKIVFLASPNNPTGNILPEEHARALLRLGLIVVVDETYHEFCGESVAPLVAEHENLVVLRSFSKWAGIA
ncbi:MAG: aminotransferase class I/II-fold pyridoxal phosphate-dependent enzyme, partial [Chloroflexota bacterium]